jgi:hypothetical protein
MQVKKSWHELPAGSVRQRGATFSALPVEGQAATLSSRSKSLAPSITSPAAPLHRASTSPAPMGAPAPLNRRASAPSRLPPSPMSTKAAEREARIVQLGRALFDLLVKRRCLAGWRAAIASGAVKRFDPTTVPLKREGTPAPWSRSQAAP